MASKMRSPRSSASRATDLGTPWAEKTTFWNIGKLIYKDGAAGAQAFNYRSVVYDFMAYVNRSAVDGERSLNDGNGAGNAGAKAARLRKKNLHVVKAWECWVWE